MGAVVVSVPVRTRRKQRPRPVAFYFDSGASDTLIRADVARRLGRPFRLPEPERFGGLGNGRFEARAVLHMHFRLAGIWLPFIAYVVNRRAMPDEVLAGHDLMQRYDIRLDPRNRRIVVDRRSLRRALLFRSPLRHLP